MLHLGKFDIKQFKSLLEYSEGWKAYPNGSPAAGMLCKNLKDNYPIQRILSQWYHITSLKWVKLHKLYPGQEIKLHADPPEGRDDAHIIHMVLSTNKDVEFCIDGKLCTMKKGNVYEIDNTLPHYVKNNGDTERVHIMIILYGHKK